MRGLKEKILVLGMIILCFDVFAKPKNKEPVDLYELAKTGSSKQLNKALKKNKDSINQHYGKTGDSLLMVALENARDFDIIELLLTWEVNPDLVNENGDTALIYATKNNAGYKTIKAVLEYEASKSKKKARVAHQNNSGQKAIDFTGEGTKERKLLLKYTKKQEKEKNKERKIEVPPPPAKEIEEVQSEETVEFEPQQENEEIESQEAAENLEEAEPQIEAESQEELAQTEPEIPLPEITEEMLASKAAAEKALETRRDPNKKMYLFEGLEAFEVYDDLPKPLEPIPHPNEKDQYGRTLLQKAVAQDDIEMINHLLKCGANINLTDSESWSPLMYAARFSKKRQTVVTLLENGADIKAKNRLDINALQIAASYNTNAEVIDEFAKHSSKKDLSQAFITAVGLGRESKILSVFLNNGISPNTFYKGKTPLMYAAETNTNTNTIKFLLDNGANKAFITADKKDAYYFAKHNPNLPRNNVYWSLNNSEE